MYNYERQKENIFTDEGQRLFLATRDNVNTLLADSGAVMMNNAMTLGSLGAADAWDMMACVDRLVELGEIREIKQGHQVAGQHRIFVRV